jgi:hypothetical protein
MKSILLTFLFSGFLLVTSVKGQGTSISAELLAETKSRWLLTQIVDLDIEVTDEGVIRLYIADFYSSPILHLKKKGKRLILENRLGREGFGPGEFIEPTNVQVLQNGLLMVYDKNQTRITLIDPKEVAKPRTILLDPPRGGHFPMETVFGTKNDSIFFTRGGLYYSDTYNPKNKREIILRAYRMDGQVKIDSVLVVPEDEPFVFIKNGSMSVNPQPWWGKKSIIRVKDGLIYYMWTGKSEVVIYNFEGQLQKKIVLEIPKLEMTEEDRKESLDFESSLSDIRKSTLKTAYYRAMPKDYWPFAHNFLVDDKGQLWMGLAAHMNEKTRVWQIYNSTGGKVGEIILPINFTIHQVKKNLIAGELFNFKNFNSIAQLYSIKME